MIETALFIMTFLCGAFLGFTTLLAILLHFDRNDEMEQVAERAKKIAHQNSIDINL